MKSKIAFTIALIISRVAYAEIDLTGSISPKPEILMENDLQTIKFKVTIRNNGSDRAQGPVLIKPFLLTKFSTLNPYSGTGAVLSSHTREINLMPQEQIEFVLSSALPSLAKADYFLSAVLNSKNTVVESKSAQMNNSLDMVAVGELESSQHFSRDSAPYNMYAEVMGDISQNWGGFSHRFRTILRKGQTFPSRDMWARFMAADFTTGKVYTLPYSSSNSDIEKNWYAVAWSDEKDKDRNAIRVDYYSQAPTYDHLLPGAYDFITLMNSHDTFNDTDVSDDLTMENVRVDAVKWSGTKEVWFADHGSSSTEQSKENWISLGYMGTDTILNPVSDDPSIATAEIIPPIAPNTTSKLNIKLNAGLSSGAYRTIIRVAAGRFPNHPLQIPVYAFVSETAPSAEFDSQTMAFESLQGKDSELKSFVIRNSGATALQFAIEAENKWLWVSQTRGEVPAGGSAEIQMRARTYGLRPSNYSSSIRLHLSDRTDSVAIPATYLLKP